MATGALRTFAVMVMLEESLERGSKARLWFTLQEGTRVLSPLWLHFRT